MTRLTKKGRVLKFYPHAGCEKNAAGEFCVFRWPFAKTRFTSIAAWYSHSVIGTARSPVAAWADAWEAVRKGT